MRRSLLILLSLSLALASCARLKRTLIEPPTAPTAANSATASVPAALTEAPVPAPTASPQPTPDFASMTFAEKNALYLELLAARQAEGMDTTAAEDAYTLSLEATLEGNSTLADQYLVEAILLLWR